LHRQHDRIEVPQQSHPAPGQTDTVASAISGVGPTLDELPSFKLGQADGDVAPVERGRPSQDRLTRRADLVQGREEAVVVAPGIDLGKGR
jgi:hypothetical protein